MNSCLITIVHFYPQNRFVEHFLFRLWVYPHDCLEMMMDVKVMELNVFLKKTLVQNIMMVWMKTSDPSSLSRSFFWMKMMMELLHAFEEQKWRQMTKINSAFMSSLLNIDVAPPTFRCVIHPESTLSLFSEWRLSRMSVWRLHLINIHHFVPSAVDCRAFSCFKHEGRTEPELLDLQRHRFSLMLNRSQLYLKSSKILFTIRLNKTKPGNTGRE